jgi:hypothetical protein
VIEPSRAESSEITAPSLDLDAYNIRVNTVNTQEFFGVPHLPAPTSTIDPIILNHVNAPIGIHLPRDVPLFFRLLYDVIHRDGENQ